MDKDLLYKELSFKAVRSGGAGGQHVNKVSSKVVLFFDIEQSKVLNEQQKSLVKSKLSSRINKEGILVLESDKTRSQIKNKEIAFYRLLLIIQGALVEDKPRKDTKIPYSKLIKRKENKVRNSQKKELRKKIR
ncbi:alternative ribosome rescue aminoacyl-tRNA hydrolase ArfB [Myroides sp. LJL115]